MRRLALVIVWAGPLLFGQAVRVSSREVQADGVIVEIAMDSPAGKTPVALQWEMTFPAQQLAVEGKGPVAGKAATDSGKVLTCAGRWKKAPETYSYTCILAGGQKPIANGPITTVSFRPAVKGPHGTASVRVEDVQGVTADLKKLVLKDAATTVAIGTAK